MRSFGRTPIQFLPVALLLTGIAIHGVRIVAFNEDPQRGSAFAMFASIDLGATREVRASVPGDPPITLKIPDTLEDQRQRLADAPSDAAAHRLALTLLDLTWEVEDGNATAGGDATVDQVRVEVVGFEAVGRTVSTRVLAEAEVGGAGLD